MCSLYMIYIFRSSVENKITCFFKVDGISDNTEHNHVIVKTVYICTAGAFRLTCLSSHKN
jgi:hypothetical protein